MNNSNYLKKKMEETQTVETQNTTPETIEENKENSENKETTTNTEENKQEEEKKEEEKCKYEVKIKLQKTKSFFLITKFFFFCSYQIN